MKLKICGISDSKTLEHLTAHPHPPEYIGFIANYQKSKRFVEFNKLKDLLKINKNNSKYVAVLVSPNSNILEKIKDLPFDYYQIYDCSSNEIKSIKEKYKKKIIAAITIKDQNDVIKFTEYNKCADIILFDGKGYEKSISFDHSYLDKLPKDLVKMVAGNIQITDLNSIKDKSFIIDISGCLENEEGKKDLNKIDKFLNTVHNMSS